MTKIAFVTIVAIAVAIMAAASGWGADNLPHQVHVLAWHIVALR